MSKLKVGIVAGARPNFMKVAPIMRALSRKDSIFEWRLVHTGQHYDREMSDVFFQELGIPAPDYHLDAGGGTHAEQTAKIMTRFEKVCQVEQFSLVIVVGDVNSTLACSITAKKLNVPVAHVEAGLRSGDMTMPEEINRLVTDSIADFFFSTEQEAVSNLMKEGKEEAKVFFVGHVMIDNLFFQLEKLPSMKGELEQSDALKARFVRYGLITLHRASNVDSRESLCGILEGLEGVAKLLPLIFPIHPRTAQRIEEFSLILPPGVITTRPLPYMQFLNLMKDAAIVLTDSGGLQEETTALGIPCLTIRENTERPVTTTHGSNTLVGTNPQRIISAAERVLKGDSPPRSCLPPLWDGKSAERIVEVLERAFTY